MSPDRRRIPNNNDVEPFSDHNGGSSDGDLFGGGISSFGGFDLRQYTAIFMRRKGLIAICTGVMASLFFIRAIQQEEVYRSSTRLLLESGGGLVVLNQKLTYVPSQSMETFTELLRTEEVMKKIISRLNLPMDPGDLEQRIVFEPNTNTSILKITVNHPEPDVAQSICREVAQVAVAEVNTIYASSTTSAHQTLGDQLEKTKIQLMKAEERIKDFVKSRGYRNLQNENSARLTRLASLTSAYNDAQVTIRSAETALDYQTARVSLTDSLVVKESTHSTPLQLEIINIETELAKLRVSHTDEHPKVVSLTKHIGQLRGLLENQEESVRIETRAVNPIRQELVRNINAERADIMRNKARQAEIRRLINEVEERLRTAPEDDLALARLEREKRGLENTYFSLLGKYEEARMLKETAQGNLQVLDEADIAVHYGPNWFVMLIFGLLAGQLFGGGLAVILDRLNPRVTFASGMERDLGIPMLGVIPGLNPDELYIEFEKPKARVAEAYGIVRANIDFAMMSDQPWSLLVTSGFQSEGKTLTSINLARSMALDGRKVCLVDGDLRRTYLHQTFEMERVSGLTEFLSEECELDQVLKDTSLGNFKIITAGRTPLNPSRLLNSDRMAALLDGLREKGYHVIFDSPAVLPIVDTSLIAPKIDGVLLLLKEEGTQKYAAQKTVERLRRVGANFVGALLNDASVKGYGYYYYYGYRYGYDYGYSEEVAKTTA